MTNADLLLDVYHRLLGAYEPQGWWPAESPFEVMVGAVLTQNTAWGNVVKAIDNLKAAGAMSPRAIRQTPQSELARMVYPSGYYNTKARKLKALVEYLGDRFDDDPERMADEALDTLRRELLGVYGIGEETADDILLYAAAQPVFVIDAYTKRLSYRLGLAPEKGPYAEYQEVFEGDLPADPDLFAEYHALIVRHVRDVCKKVPICEGCALLEVCPTGKAATRR